MRLSLRFPVVAAGLFALAACSPSGQQPAMSDDLKQDLARVGASDVQLAGSNGRRLDVVSVAERTDARVPAPHAPSVTRVPSAHRGASAPVRSAVRSEMPVASAPAPRAVEVAPAEAREPEPAPEPVNAAGRPRAPRASTQREPAGGWRSTSEVIRNSPFPINP